MMHNTLHIRIRQVKCFETETLLQFELRIRLESFKREIENKNIFTEAITR
jgi:hypothetical protein